MQGATVLGPVKIGIGADSSGRRNSLTKEVAMKKQKRRSD
jgi:hypothetical protein